MRGARPIIISATILLLAIIVGFVLAAMFGVLLETLYITLILLAILMIIATVAQVYSIVVFVRTIGNVRDEVQPLVASVNDTVNIVKDTAKTAGHAVSTIGSTTDLTTEFFLGPSIRATATIVAVQQMFRIFLGKGQVARQHEKRRKEQMQAGAGGER